VRGEKGRKDREGEKRKKREEVELRRRKGRKIWVVATSS
jgi:hypothetical protein